MSSLSKAKIDQLGDRLRGGKIAEEDLRSLDGYRRSFSSAYESVIATIREILQVAPTGRPAKSTSSIIEKLNRETIRLTQIQDIAGCRVIVTGIVEQNTSIRALSIGYPDVDVVDRRLHPSHGYRAVHLVARIAGKPIEIQVRTMLQHAWAEYSEKLSDVIDPAIKYGGGRPDVLKLLSEYADLVRTIEAAEIKPGTKAMAAKLAEVRDAVRESLEALTKEWSKPG